METLMERFKSLTRYWWAMLILGVAIFVVGILIFTYPGESYIGMAALFAVLMLVSGIIEVVIAFTEKYMVGRGWAAVLGVLEIILGIILICSPAITAMQFIDNSCDGGRQRVIGNSQAFHLFIAFHRFILLIH